MPYGRLVSFFVVDWWAGGTGFGRLKCDGANGSLGRWRCWRCSQREPVEVARSANVLWNDLFGSGSPALRIRFPINSQFWRASKNVSLSSLAWPLAGTAGRHWPGVSRRHRSFRHPAAITLNNSFTRYSNQLIINDESNGNFCWIIPIRTSTGRLYYDFYFIIMLYMSLIWKMIFNCIF